ncbi:dCTP deaminase, dUMP-forming [subsurface metagenome]
MLHSGAEVYISGEDTPRRLSKSSPFVNLPRGQFALLMTNEYVTVPKDHFGLISIRFGKKAQGLINVSGFHVDPGFEGKILFSVFNAGPSDVVLKYGEPTFMIFFYKLRESVDQPYKGERKGQEHLPTGLVTSVKGVSASLSDVDRRVSRLEVTIRVLEWLLVAGAVGLVVIFLRGTFGI